MLSWLRPRRHERAGYTLYAAAVKAARDPALFTEFGVPDTFDGRFDLVCVFAALLMCRLCRLPPPGPELAQAVFDAMFSDMDMTLREMGVSDLGLPKRMRAMWEAFHGRALAYAAGLEALEREPLEWALIRNVWRGIAPGAAAIELAALVRAQAAHLESQEATALMAGRVNFLAPARPAP